MYKIYLDPKTERIALVTDIKTKAPTMLICMSPIGFFNFNIKDLKIIEVQEIPTNLYGINTWYWKYKDNNFIFENFGF